MPQCEWAISPALATGGSYGNRKNDKAWVAQKTGAIVRCLVGYGWFEGRVRSSLAVCRISAA